MSRTPVNNTGLWILWSIWFSSFLVPAHAQHRSVGEDFVIHTGTTLGNLTEKMRITQGGLIAMGMVTPTYQLDVSGTVRATNFIGDGSGLTNLSADNLGNHIATQNLGLGTNTIVFGNIISDKIYLYSNTYGIGMESSNLTHWSGSAFRWRIGGTSASTGSQQMYLNTTGLVVSGSISVNTDDAVTAPGFTWNGDSNTGLYWVGADQIGVTTGGAQRGLFSSGGLKVTGTVTTTGIIDAGSYIYGYTGDSASAPGYTWSGDNNTGMYNAAADIVGFSAGGTERFRVTASGISTTGNLSLHTGGYVYGDNGDTNYTSGLYLYAGKDANTGGYISLCGIDHSSSPGRLAYVAVTDTAGSLLHRFYSRTTAGSAATVLSLYQGGDATLAGDMTASAFLYSSDEILKKNIRSSQGLALVRQLEGRVFDWKSTGKHASGVVAQEVEKAMPFIVHTGKEGTKVVDYLQLIAPLIEAVKDLDRENQILKTELRDQRDAFNARLEKLERR